MACSFSDAFCLCAIMHVISKYITWEEEEEAGEEEKEDEKGQEEEQQQQYHSSFYFVLDCFVPD